MSSAPIESSSKYTRTAMSLISFVSQPGYLLGLSPQDCLGHFLFTKLLPRISFFKGSNKIELFDQLLNALDKDLKALGTNLESYDPGDVLTQLQAQVDDSRRQYVRYWVRT